MVLSSTSTSRSERRRRILPRRSLIGDLFMRVSALLALIILAVGVTAFVTARKQVDTLYDGQLIAGANVLVALMSDERREQNQTARPPRTLEVTDAPLLSPEDRDAFNSYADWRMFRVWRNGQLEIGSDTGPQLPPPAANQSGFSPARQGAQMWRIYTLPLAQSNIVVQVGERPGVRDDLVQKIALDLALPLLILIPLSGALIWMSLTDGLRQLRGIIAQLGARGANLAPLSVGSAPVDLVALIRPINQLLERVQSAVARERSFVDHAAHQLRTPLAAMRLEAQMLSRETDPLARTAHSERLLKGVDRAALLVEQLLTLARLDSQTEISRTSTLQAQVTDAMTAIVSLASARNVELVFDTQGADAVGDPTLLRLIASNLIENAVYHAPPNTDVTIGITERPQNGHTLTVADHGAGLLAEERARVFDRFYRVADDRTPGAGLGLSIVWEAVRQLNGAISLRDREDGASGLVVCVDLPPRPEA